MILGETQILGQMRDAWQKSGEIGTSGKIFNTLFRQAVTFAKRVHTQTSIGQNAVSVSYAAVQLAKKEIERFASKRVLIVGAGKMSRLTAKHLEELGVDELMVASRTLERAEQLAMEFNGSAYTMEQLADCLKRADIVISSTGAAELVISKAMVEQAMKDRPGSVMLMIDIAVPRDLDPELAQLDSVLLYDIDDLEGIIQSNLEQRRKEAIKIRTLLIQEVNQFKEWFATLEMIPVVSALRKKALLIQEETMRSIERKIPDLDEREKKVLRKHTKSIVNQLLKEPILQLKEMSGTEESAKALELISKIFGLQEFLMEEQAEKEGSFADMSYLEVGS
jgi:glutamyl-tRNA reductase